MLSPPFSTFPGGGGLRGHTNFSAGCDCDAPSPSSTHAGWSNLRVYSCSSSNAPLLVGYPHTKIP